MFEYTWRWYGPNDRITLREIKQAGAVGIVSALHHIPNGEVWSVEEIEKRKDEIEAIGLKWSVVESVPVHEDIKKQTGKYLEYIENYKTTLRNLSQFGIRTVCYNFMPVLDWSRTHINYEMPDGSLTLLYKMADFAAFDLFILKRPNAEKDYTPAMVEKAKAAFDTMTKSDRDKLSQAILAGLPGSEESYSLTDFQTVLDSYAHIDRDKLQEHLFYFIKEVIPVAEECGMLMGIHPDDPSWNLLGLPRVMSSVEDAKALIEYFDSPSNGVTLCTGSWGTNYQNDLVEMTKTLASRINFVHLRNVQRDEDFNFMEHYLFQGDIDIFGVMKALVDSEDERDFQNKYNGHKLPLRPDHGNQMLDDIGRDYFPGYSLYGRMKALDKIKGLEVGIRGMMDAR
jgi:mannonate dehydratase